MTSAEKSISRRGLLGAAAVGLTLAGCTSKSPTSSATSASAATQSSSAPPSPHSAEQGPTRAQIVDRFAAEAPTQWGLNLPGEVIQIPNGSQQVALTFDACGGPHGAGYDADLISTLRAHKVPATLFLNTRWIQANPSIAAELAADPLFEIARHGHRHVPLSVRGRSAYGITGTANVGEVYDELTAGSEWFAGAPHSSTTTFRSGTAFCDDVSVRIASALGLRIVGFTVNADAGATYPGPKVAEMLQGARAGDIVISHFNHPGRGTAPGYAAALPGLLARGVSFVRLSDTSAARAS